MKPRIVRESAFPGSSGCALHGDNRGPAYLALPWPTECPYGPEAVMAACERAEAIPRGVPSRGHNAWFIGTDKGYYALTPEFMAEPKSCGCRMDNFICTLPAGHTGDHRDINPTSGGCVGWLQKCEHTGTIECCGDARGFQRCCACGAILSDRRKGERRKGGRRPDILDKLGGGRRAMVLGKRRRPYDRRRSHV